MMRNHIARLEQQKEELTHKLEESKVERQMFDNSEDNEGENEQELDEEDEEPQYPPVDLKNRRYPNPSTTMGSIPSSQPLSLK